MGQTLIDHALSYTLTATANVLAVYIQQFWKTVKQVPNANNSIRFMIDRETVTYTMDMLRDTLQLPVETPDQPFIEPANLKFIQRFLKIVGYEGIFDKLNVFYINNLAQQCKRCSRSSSRLDEYYHSIKDDIPLVSLYTMRNVIVKEMLIPNEFLTDDICTTMDYKEYEKVFGRVDIPTIQLGEDIDKMVDGDDEDSYASDFADLIFQDEEDIRTRIEPGSHKENLEVDDDDVNDNIDKEKRDDEKKVNDDIEDEKKDK
uniref:Uncharacterized protein n=1 Tax=Tanacetum cinerariifolium TaxID=118510 RepID=A0A699HVT1_TANCI|nr:hypothetical protein [Tanacetum cinerariifolium]